MARRSFKCYVEQEMGKFPLFVIYALLEWFLIILLFIDWFLAFAANEFARFFEMRVPCLLCTRIDHVLVRRSPDFYYNESVCDAHKKEVSSLAFCHVHKRLSDIRKMCEGCLLSFATEKDSDCYTYKSLVGILHKDLDCFVHDDYSQVHLPVPKRDDLNNSANMAQLEKDIGERCSCCSDPLRMRPSSSYSRGSVQKAGKSTSPISQAPAPSPRAFMALRNGEGPNVMLPHIRYTELKFIDADHENPDEDGNFHASAPENHGKEDMRSAAVPLIAEADDITEAIKTPTFARGNRFFGIPLSDSANASPRWSTRAYRKSPLEKMEFANENTDGTNDSDGCSILSHLKRQVRLDRKSLMALYMELDEERSASAVAANNAMAMITRLQAEKAAVQMEALQYQRMMEEQAEYDQEALQEMNGLLGKREEEIKALETELEAYRNKYGCLKEDDYEICKFEIDEEYEDLEPQSYSFEEEEIDAPRPTERTRTLKKFCGFKQYNSEIHRHGDESIDVLQYHDDKVPSEASSP